MTITTGSDLSKLRALIADDGYAMTFQTFGQYRTALLGAIDQARDQASLDEVRGGSKSQSAPNSAPATGETCSDKAAAANAGGLDTTAFHLTARQIAIICEGLKMVRGNPASADERATAERLAHYLSQPQAHTPAAADAGGLPSLQEARDMGAKGGPICHNQRALFTAWMEGHCWEIGNWVSTPSGGQYDTMESRMLWAAWRDCAALHRAPATSAAALPKNLTVAELHPDGHTCRCPHCRKLNMDLDVSGDPAGQEFMCIRCGEGFRIADRAAAKGAGGQS